MKNFVLLFLLLALISCNENDSEEVENPPVDSLQIENTDQPSNNEVPTLTGPKFLPIDEASQDPTFVEFRNKLLKVIEEKDKEYLLRIVHPQAHLSFGVTEGGREGFRKMWFNYNNDDSPLWEILKIILNNGGTFYKYEGQKK